MTTASESGAFETYECGDCGRIYLVRDAAGMLTICPVCESTASEFVGLFEINRVDTKGSED